MEIIGIQAVPFSSALVLGGLALVVLIFIRGSTSKPKQSSAGLPPVPGTNGIFIFLFLFF